MNTKIYEYLIAVAEQKNITRAAEQYFITQPALTQHIKKLESEYNFTLFKKKGTELIPSRQGEVFLTTAQRMLQIEKETYAKIELCKKVANQTYRVFVDIHMRNVFIDRIWPQFLEQNPDVKLSLISGDTNSALEYINNQLIDVGIFPMYGAFPSGIDHIPIDQNEYLLVLPSSHPKIEQFSNHKIDFQLLKDETFILNQSFSLFSSMQHQILERYGITPKRTLNAHAMQSIVRMVSNGQGVSFLPDVIVQLVNHECASFSLDPPWYFHHVVAYHKSQGLTDHHALLANLFIKHYQQFHLTPDS